MNSKPGFIFDMDGVIVDSNPFHKIALIEFCRKHGKDLSEEELREKIYGRRNQEWLLHVFGELKPDQMKAFAEEKEALYREVYEKDIKPVAGLIPFLTKLDSMAIPRAIATSAPRSNVDFTIHKTHIARYFDTILDDSFVTQGKPDPEIYLKAAKALNFAPGDCVVFEDSLAGVDAAKSAGCKVVGITTTHTREELQETDFIIDNFEKLHPGDLISKLFPA